MGSINWLWMRGISGYMGNISKSGIDRMKIGYKKVSMRVDAS